jgi:N utilization substance protein B
MNEDTKPGPKPPKPRRTQLRHASRLAAVQALYQVEHAGDDAESVILEFLTHRGGAVLQEAADEPAAALDETHFSDLVRGALRRQSEIDRWLGQAVTKSWPLPRLDAVLRAILRCACYELWARADVPARVIITEYVDIAHAFFSGEEPGIVNAVLDRLGRKLRAADLEPDPHGRNGTTG